MRTVALVFSVLAFVGACAEKPGVEPPAAEQPSAVRPNVEPASTGQTGAEQFCPRTEYWIDVWSSKQTFLVARVPDDLSAAWAPDHRTGKFKFLCQAVTLPPDPDGKQPDTVETSLLDVQQGTLIVVDASGEVMVGYNKTEGARCFKADDCNRGSYCNQKPTTCTAPGRCEKRRDKNNCDKDIEPVIGCDNKRYENPCLAAAEGVSIKEYVKDRSGPSQDAPKE